MTNTTLRCRSFLQDFNGKYYYQETMQVTSIQDIIPTEGQIIYLSDLFSIFSEGKWVVLPANDPRVQGLYRLAVQGERNYTH